MRLHDLSLNQTAQIKSVEHLSDDDRVATRLSELGFIPKETLKVIARAGKRADSLVIKLGNTKFALRHSEAHRIILES